MQYIARHQRHVSKPNIERLEVGKVLPAVNCCQRPIGHLVKQRKMKLIDMEMQDVKFFSEAAYPVEHQHVIGDRITDVPVETQCCGRAAHELGSGDEVRACEQGHLVTQSDQLIREIGNNSLCPAIKPRRHALHKRRNLRNFHVIDFQGTAMAASFSEGS